MARRRNKSHIPHIFPTHMSRRKESFLRGLTKNMLSGDGVLILEITLTVGSR